MMYFRSLLQGMANLPSADETVRAELAAEAGVKGWPALHRQLAEVDPQAATRIHPNDPQRISRALEVYRLTGVPLSEWMRQPMQALPYQPILLGLVPSNRAVLHERIAQRFRQMLQSGLVDEVQALYQRGDLSLETPAMRSVGYRQVWQYLSGQLPYQEMLEKGIIATRQLAKRQLTWLRSMPDMNNIDFLNKDLDEKVLKILAKIHIN
jgi:tRNA dimethylallyltransferase